MGGGEDIVLRTALSAPGVGEGQGGCVLAISSSFCLIPPGLVLSSLCPFSYGEVRYEEEGRNEMRWGSAKVKEAMLSLPIQPGR